MTLYWPTATYKKTEGIKEMNTLFTYEACVTLEEAKKVIHKWANDCDYHLLSAQIMCDYGNRKRTLIVF